MLGILDLWYAWKSLRKKKSDRETDWAPEVVRYDDSNYTWICFVPIFVSGVKAIRDGLIPKEGTVIIYTISSSDLILESSEETVKKLQQVYDHAVIKLSEAENDGKIINLFGVSLGNVLSIRLAAQAKKKINRIVSLVGGSNLGLSGWDSILTGGIARRTGCKSAEEYESRLSVFSPTNYIDKIHASRVIIRLGTCDLLIHFKHGKKLATMFIERSKKTPMKISYKAYLGADHGSAIFIASRELIL